MRGFLWAEVARLADSTGHEHQRADAARMCQSADAEFKPQLLAGVRSLVADGDIAGATKLMARLRAVAPRDLEVIDLARQLASAIS